MTAEKATPSAVRFLNAEFFHKRSNYVQSKVGKSNFFPGLQFVKYIGIEERDIKQMEKEFPVPLQ
jgi:hypothetical protein